MPVENKKVRKRIRDHVHGSKIRIYPHKWFRDLQKFLQRKGQTHDNRNIAVVPDFGNWYLLSILSYVSCALIFNALTKVAKITTSLIFLLIQNLPLNSHENLNTSRVLLRCPAYEGEHLPK